MSIVAVDVGATKVRIASFRGRRIQNKKIYSIAEYGDPVKIIESYVNELGGARKIGIASAGPLDIKMGSARLLNFGNLEVNYVERLGRLARVYLANDCVAGLLAEHKLGAARGSQNAVYITFSTGIGAGVMVDGHFLLGKDGNAHEVGHLVLNFEDDVKCGCGGTGHWEAYCGGRNMPVFYKKLTGSSVSSSHEIFTLYNSGDRKAIEFMERCMKINAAGVASVINAYDPEIVVLGGSVYLNNSEVFDKMLRKYIAQYVINRPPAIVRASLGDEAVIYGAGLLAAMSGRLP
ncbi:MAG: ROK family protein [Nitrososphaeria archaeon]